MTARFDLLWLDGKDLGPVPYWRRKKALAKLVVGTSIRYVEESYDPNLFEAVVQLDVEGIVAKRRGDAYYVETTEWLKIKHPTYSQKDGRAEFFHRKR